MRYFRTSELHIDRTSLPMCAWWCVSHCWWSLHLSPWIGTHRFPVIVLPHFSWLRPKLCCYKSPDSPFVVISHPHLVNSTSLLSEIAIFVGQIPILPCWLKSISILLAEPPNFCWISTHHSGFYYIGNSTFWSLKSLFFVLFVKVQVAWSPTFECLESRFLGWYPQCSLTAYFSCLKSHFDRFDEVINLWLFVFVASNPKLFCDFQVFGW